MNAPLLSRRAFIATGLSAGGGLIVAVANRRVDAAPIGPAPWSEEGGRAAGEVDAFVVIEPDETILLRIAKSEMGQGVLTSLAMILAEELECDFAKVKVEYASAHRNLVEGGLYGSMGTGGSRSVRGSREMLQQAGASARERLIRAAAQQWGVPPETCRTMRGVVLHDASNRQATYGALAAAAGALPALAKEPAIKTPDQFKLIGTRQARFDTPAKINGSAQFGIDARVDGMVYAAVANCPVFGGKLKSYDETAINNRRGIIAVVPVTNGVAVVADRFWRAKEAVAALPIVWDEGAAASTGSAQFRAEYRAALDGPVANAAKHGDVAAAMNGATIVEALYEAPHLAHAPMEPLNALAHWREDRLDVWLGTQDADAALKLAAKAGGLDRWNVYVHNCYLGGGFGRRAVNDELRQAVEVSKALRKPVKLVWTREQDIQHDRYRPQAAIRMKAALGPDGMPTAFDFRTAVGSISRSLGWDAVKSGVERQAVEGLANCPYKVAALNVDCALKNTHVPVMFWRSVGSSQNAFAVESFIDEVAHAAKKDPYEFRRALLADRPDFVAVLDKLADKGDWGKPLPADTGRGIAIHEAFGTIVGEIAEVQVGRNGEVKVKRVVACVDCGHVVNPTTVEMQIEGAVLYGLTAALFGEITIKQGRVEQSNFYDYLIARMGDSPVIETHFALSGGGKWGGVGEPGTPPIAPAVANAVFAVTEKRIRSLPLKNANLGA
jgi:isoquinoline 1-oxidoreductase beta subunit